ncbi:EAL domain-containing protein [Teredinibacter sp. KSP-S5-2]|uniref:two-component system response regulator n=1 Tax=Teredinibacter sp. KSP-S5-2 TaxID=3034506 RepID=UPI0029344FB3|nr:EAL domain-containing protein [Teredinibacter sp. KSP-S5-2]WNO08401.1 EAL domain-containing protein [Teredinibacter sp. KSP-S5-2]
MSDSTVFAKGSDIRSVLVVSHNRNVQAKVKACLKGQVGVDLLFADTAKGALQTLRHTDIDILVGDVETPDIDGWRLSRLIRSGILKCRDDIPILMISSTWCERIAEVTAREYGINDMIPLDHIDRIPGIIEEYRSTKTRQENKPHLLVIEDQPDTSDLIVRVLQSVFDIEVAADGEAGLAAWRHGRHDLVLLDLMLPKLYGTDVLKEIIREHPRQAVVIMTAHANIDQAEELMQIGAADFLAKPFRPEQLRKVCNIASLRDDYLVSNEQFAARVRSIRESETAFKRLYQTHHRLLDDLLSVVIEIDENLTIHYLNKRWQVVTGFDLTYSIGKPLEKFISPRDHGLIPVLKNKLQQVLDHSSEKVDFDLCLLTHSQKEIWTQLMVSGSTGEGDARRFTVCLNDVTEQRRTRVELEYLATHDSLTSLFNRHYFEKSLSELAIDARRSPHNHFLIYIDLDHFKVINDSFGHQQGDELIQEIAKVLRKQLREGDMLARLGGDEFAVLVKTATDDEAKQVAIKLKDAIGQCKFQLQDQAIQLGSCMGLARIDGSATSPEEYLKQADIALYVAKGRGRNLVHLYNPCDQESELMRSNINWSQKIREAIAENRIILYFQPIFNVSQNKVAYYEALVRCRERNGDIAGPHLFIPALENTGEMNLLDRKIIDVAISTLRSEPKLGHVAINLSAQAFKDEDLVPYIITCLKEYQVDPKRITFELTESDSLFNLNVTRSVIERLHELGCCFSVDDFGSGFSSFSYLKQLPADYIKIDGSFIQNMHADDVDRSLVKPIIQVIQALGKKAVAEFVENEEIFDILKEMGVDYVQGYHIGKPMPVEKIFG